MDVIANGIRLSYTDSGSGHPVILLNGNGLSPAMWRHFEPELQKHSRSIALRSRGMVGSETVGKPGLSFTIDDHGRDLVAFLDVLGIEKAAIVGHAYGGYVAMRVAIDRPDRVSAIVPSIVGLGSRAPHARRFLDGPTPWSVRGWHPWWSRR